jgi:hypothetical protein
MPLARTRNNKRHYKWRNNKYRFHDSTPRLVGMKQAKAHEGATRQTDAELKR